MAELIKVAGRTEYAISALGEVAANVLIGGRDAAVGSRVVPNANFSFDASSGSETDFLNLNRKNVSVDRETESLTGGNLALKVGNETDIWYIDRDGKFKWDIEFTSQPLTNVFEWEITKSPGVYFAHQPELTAQEIADGDVRPENVVGSYAVYCNRRNHARRPDGSTITNYMTGKLAHIYRPLCIDANGSKAWADLDITGDSLRITIPQAYLDSAVYPMTLDPTLGLTTAGASWNNAGDNAMDVCNLDSMPEAGTLDSLHYYAELIDNNTREIILVLFDDSSNPNALVASSAQFYDAARSFGNPGWVSQTMSSESLANGATLYVGKMQEAGASRYYYDANAGYTQYNDTTGTFPTVPDPFIVSSSSGTRQISAYITYTASGGGGALLDAAVSCAVTVAAALTTGITVAANVAASGVVTAVLTTSILLGSAVNATATPAAALTTDIRLAASVVSTATGTAALTTGVTLDASVSASATQASGLTTQIEIGSTVSAAATAAGELTVGLNLDAAVTASIAAAGGLSTQIPLSASVAASSVTAAQLTTGISLSANVGGLAASTAALATDITLSAGATAAASASGFLNAQKIYNTVRLSADFQPAAAKKALFNVTRKSGIYFTRTRTKEVWF